VTNGESRTALASPFHCGRDGVLFLCSRVEVGDVLVVYGLRVEVKTVSGEGPFAVPIGAARLPAHLPAGEPVRIFGVGEQW
jgi:hypothetical protein